MPKLVRATQACHEGRFGSLWAHSGLTTRPFARQEYEISQAVPHEGEDGFELRAYPGRGELVAKDPGGCQVALGTHGRSCWHASSVIGPRKATRAQTSRPDLADRPLGRGRV